MYRRNVSPGCGGHSAAKRPRAQESQQVNSLAKREPPWRSLRDAQSKAVHKVMDRYPCGLSENYDAGQAILVPCDSLTIRKRRIFKGKKKRLVITLVPGKPQR